MAAFEHVLVLALAYLHYTNAESPCTPGLHDSFCDSRDKNLTTVPGPPSDTVIQYLDLSDNHIKTLLPNDFVNYPKLSQLLLSGNGLETIHPDAFTGLTKLVSLKLSDNLLRTFPCHALRDLPSLRSLKLDNNTISSIPSDCTLPSLNVLELSNNRLESLPCDDPKNCFLDLETKTALNLKNNQLQTLPETFCRFGDPTKLTLDGNPWRCDDSLLPLLSCNVSSRIKCAMPFSVSGDILSNLSSNQLVRRADVNVTITGGSTVSIGDTVNLRCNVQGTTSVNITWGKIQKTGDDHFYPEGSNLLLTNVSKADAGVYICEVSIGNTKAWGTVRLDVLSVPTPSTTLPSTVQSSKVTTDVTTIFPNITKDENKTKNISIPVGDIRTPSPRIVQQGLLGWHLIVIIFAAVFLALIVTCLALAVWKKLGWGNVDSLPQYEGPIPIVVVDSPPASPRGDEVVFMDEDQQYGSKQSLASYDSYDKHNHNGDDELSDELDHPGSQGHSAVTRSLQDERSLRTHLEDERKQLIDGRHSMGRRSVDSSTSSRASRNSRPKTSRRGEREAYSSREHVQRRRRSRDHGDNISASTQSSDLLSSRSHGSRRSRRRRKPLVPDVIFGDEDDIDGQSQAGTTKKTIASERDLWKRWNPQRHSTSRRDMKSRAGGRAIATGRGAEIIDLGNATPPEEAMHDSFELQDFSRARPPKRQTSQRSLSEGQRSAQRRPRRGREDVDSGKGSSKEV